MKATSARTVMEWFFCALRADSVQIHGKGNKLRPAELARALERTSRGIIELIRHRLPAEVTGGLWQWKKRARE